MNRTVQHWQHWWLRKGPPQLIALIRIGFGAYLFFYFSLRLPHVAMLFSNVGLAIPYDLYLPEALKFLLAPPSIKTAYIIFGMFLMSLMSFALGYKTRTSATIAFILFAYYMMLSLHHYSTSYNRLFLFITFLFTFSDAGNTYSMDMKQKHGSWTAEEPASILTQRLIAFQLFATYFGVAMQKVWLPGWQGGEILFYSFQGMWATPLAFWFAALIPMTIYDWMVEVVIYGEVAFALGLWFRHTRIVAMIGGFLFHFIVTFFLAAIWWFWIMVPCYLCFFEPEEVQQKLKLLQCYIATVFAKRTQAQHSHVTM